MISPYKKKSVTKATKEGSRDVNGNTLSRNLKDKSSADEMKMSTFQTRFSRESSKNILDSLNEFFVSSKSVNHNVVGGEMRRQRSEMLIDRTSHTLVPINSQSFN